MIYINSARIDVITQEELKALIPPNILTKIMPMTFNDGDVCNVDQFFIPDLYVKMGISELRIRNYYYRIYNKNGERIPFKFKSALLDGEYYLHRWIPYIIKKIFAHVVKQNGIQFPSLSFLVYEKNAQKAEDLLSFLDTKFKSKFTIPHANENFVQACRSCDQVLSKDQQMLNICPFCNNSMKLYERLGMIHLVEIDLTSIPDYEIQIDHQRKESDVDHHQYLNVWIQGVSRPARFETEDIKCILEMISRDLPDQMIGPFNLYGIPDVQANIMDLYFVNNLAMSISTPIIVHDVNQIYPKKFLSLQKATTDIGKKIAKQTQMTQDAHKVLDNKTKQKMQQKQAIIQKKKRLESKNTTLISLIEANQQYQLHTTIEGVYLRFSNAYDGSRPKLYATLHLEDGRLVLPKSDTSQGTRTIDSISLRWEAINALTYEFNTHVTQFYPQMKIPIKEVVEDQSSTTFKCNIKLVNDNSRVKKGVKVAVCAECNSVLIGTISRSTHEVYAFSEWAYYSNAENPEQFLPDIKICPYCHKTLQVKLREPRKMELELGSPFHSLLVKILDQNIRISYNMKVFLEFLKNIESSFPEQVLGPFTLRLGFDSGVFSVEHLTWGVPVKDLDSRPGNILPEDYDI